MPNAFPHPSQTHLALVSADVELHATPKPENAAAHKPLESESFVQCPHLQLYQLFWRFHVSPMRATPLLGLFNGIIVLYSYRLERK